MSTKMLINAQRAQQVRVAIVADGILRDYQVEVADRDLCRGNIYRGVVANIQPSLNAAFIDIGEERHGFLPVADVSESAYHKQPPKDAKRPRIDQVLEKGKTIVVQVTKDGVGQKGPALTTNVALAGRYLVFTPFDEVRGISRKAEDDAARKSVRERLKKLNLPEGNGVIVRTNGLEQNQTTLNRDLSALVRLWKKIKTEIGKGRGARFLYSDQNLVVQALRDYLDKSISEVVVDEPEVHSQVQDYMRTFMPRTKIEVELYEERLPLFSRYRLETQIDRIYERQAPLPSGGSVVIDTTEALTAIDVNSGRATRNNNHDESILNTNLEAAREVARQLRLRDIGGLVVVDFIDMRLRKHQQKLEKVMRDAMKDDKARYSVGRISSNGLLEINRQRIKQAIRLRTHRPCPTCDGVGTIASAEFAALNLLGRIESRVATGLVDRVTIALHPEIADTLQNQYRGRLAQLEAELELVIEIISAPGYARLEERLDFHQREEGLAPKSRSGPALTATDLTMPQGGRRGAKEDLADESADESPTRRRRRRRKSSRSRDDEATTQQDEMVASDEQNRDDETQDSSERKPRRRRRRRRSGRSRNESTVASSGEETQSTHAEAAEDSASKPRGRFARREELQEYNDSAYADEGAAEGLSADDGDERPTRTRRRRRRRRSSADADAPESVEATSSSGDAPEAPRSDDEETPPLRRRRRSTAPAEDSEAPATDEPKLTRRRRSKAAEAEDTAEVAEAKPKRRRRSKAAEAEDEADSTEAKPTRRRRSKAADTEDAADSAEAKPTRRRRSKAADTEDAADSAEAKPTRRRRSKAADTENEADSAEAKPTRRRRSKAAEGEDAADAAEAKPKRRRRSAASAAKDEGDAAEAKPTRRRRSTASEAKGEGDATEAKPTRRRRSAASETKDEDDAPPRQRRRRSDSRRDASGNDNGSPARQRRPRKAKSNDDNIGNRSDTEPTHTTTSLAYLGNDGKDPNNRRRRSSRRRRSGEAKLSTPPDIAKGDIILPEQLPGAHKPGSPPPKRTGISTQSLRWQWWGGNDDKGGSE